MNLVSINPGFGDSEDHRLLAMDSVWVAALKRHMNVRQVNARKRTRESPAPVAPRCPSVVLVMKGKEHLCASDSSETLMVRRVEFSNSLLVAERRQRSTEDSSEREQADALSAEMPAEALRKTAENVVFASLARLFEAQVAAPQQNVIESLKESLISLEALEGSDVNALGTDHDARGESTSGGRQLYTFTALAAQNNTSPRELARVLAAAGAIVHQGYVRLLEPVVLHEALCAVLTFLSSATAADLSWSAIEDHFCPGAFPRVVIGAVRGVYGAADSEEVDASLEVSETGLDKLVDLGKVAVGLAGAAFESSTCAAAAQLRGDLPHGVRTASVPFNTFYDTWIDSLPDSMFGRGVIPPRTARVEDFLALLTGYVVCHRQRKDSFDGATAWWLPRDSMPNDIQKRLEVLFALRDERYAADVVRAYVQPLLAPDQAFAHVILRHAREYRIPGEPVMYARLAAQPPT